MPISIIIPVYNEVKNIAKLVSYLQQHASQGVLEIIVADAASTDDTAARALEAGAIVCKSPEKGRAAQMNHAAAIAKGDVLYFVHADTLPPVSYAADVYKAVEGGFHLGRYVTKFNSPKWYLKINNWFTTLDWFICMGGDNTLFVAKEVFEASGGFRNDMIIMEEYEFCARLRKQGCRYKIMKGSSLVSARKYDACSWWQVLMANRTVVGMYKKGASQQALVDRYKQLLAPKSS
ncbi:MAG: TIGR04283 family arsenosugar biosynthesis glycosyltransferase [Chitinophagaceae bacterium]